jgi:hypothetical protein
MATLAQTGIPGSGNGILHPKHRNRFQVVFVGLSGGATNLTRQVITCNRPTLDFDEIKLDRYNSTAYVAGKHSWSEFQCTLEDDLTGLASSAVQLQLERQQRLIGSDHATGNYLNTPATADAYKFAVRLEMLDGNEVVAEQWYMEGAWIKSADYGDLDYASSAEASTIALTIRYDHAWQLLNSAAAGALGINATTGFLSNASDFNGVSV